MKILLEVQVLPRDNWRKVEIDGFKYISPSTDEEIASGEYEAELYEKGYVAEELGRLLRTWLSRYSNYTVGEVRARIRGEVIDV